MLNLEGPDVGVAQLPSSTKSNIATNLLQVAVIAKFRERHGYRGNETSPGCPFGILLPAVVSLINFLSY